MRTGALWDDRADFETRVLSSRESYDTGMSMADVVFDTARLCAFRERNRSRDCVRSRTHVTVNVSAAAKVFGTARPFSSFLEI